jgi:protein-S-isoprenylcysteine O-methyltransferase Ste14
MSKLPKLQEESGFFLPRWAVPYVWAVIVLVIQIMLPWVISILGPRFGWSQQKPALWNFSGMLPIIMGLIMYGWCLSFHFKTYSASVRLGVSPPRLVTNGPYQVSRNPMYVSGLFVWFGWLIFFGSPSVFIAFLLLYVIFSFRVIPLEECQLEELFGKDYLDYKISVRRWFGRF